MVISSGERVITYPPDFPYTEVTRPARDKTCPSTVARTTNPFAGQGPTERDFS
jgi:hypothetical protein